MKLGDIYAKLDAISPFSIQEAWDNSGLIIGSFEQAVGKIVLSIDVDEELIDSLAPNTLLITHHPLIFKGLKRLDFSTYPANLLKKMSDKNISNIAMHTNFDKTHLGAFVANSVLDYKIIKQDGFVVYLEVNEPLELFAKNLALIMGIAVVKVVKSAELVKTAALITGSGGSMVDSIKADCLISGDIKYHDAMLAKSLNISIVDIGHFESERFFPAALEPHLKNLGLEAIISSSKNPYTYL